MIHKKKPIDFQKFIEKFIVLQETFFYNVQIIFKAV